MTRRNEVLAFRIWQYCEPRGWDCTITEVANALGESRMSITNIVYKREWNTRLRSTKTGDDFHWRYLPSLHVALDRALDELS